jgi:hypothetical protein
MGIWSLAFFTAVPPNRYYSHYSLISVLASMFYPFLLTIPNVLFAVYFLRGKTTSTIIPCISRPWYKAYTVLLMVTMCVLVAFLAVETSRGPNGLYKSFPTDVQMDCEARTRWWAVSPQDTFLGVVSLVESNITTPEVTAAGRMVAEVLNRTATSNEKLWLYDFTGYCVGTPGGT